MLLHNELNMEQVGDKPSLLVIKVRVSSQSEVLRADARDNMIDSQYEGVFNA